MFLITFKNIAHYYYNSFEEYIYNIETFWFKDFSDTQDITAYCLKYLQIYILMYLCQNQKREKVELITKIFGIISGPTKISILSTCIY